MTELNNQIFYYFYGLAHKSSVGDATIVFIAQSLPYIFILGAGLFLVVHHEVTKDQDPLRKLWEKKLEILDSFITASIAWCVGSILKLIFHASRPASSLHDVIPLIKKNDFSFPSGHATFFMALAFSIVLFHKKAGYWFIFIALLISLARIASGVHYPVDILGGWILGILIACFARKLTK